MANQYNMRNKEEDENSAITERTVRINRVSKVIKGGRHLSFSAMVVVGDGEGKVGIGMGKADAVPDAIRKGSVYAQKNMVEVPIKNDTIPHEVLVKFGGSVVMLKPAPQGTGVIAGDSVRAVVELAGTQTKKILYHRRNHNNNVIARNMSQ